MNRALLHLAAVGRQMERDYGGMLHMTEEATPGYLYRLLDAPGGPPLATFQELTGGEMEISMVSYTQITDAGETKTKHIPGQVKYSPITMLRPIDIESRIFFQEFEWGRSGKMSAAKRNFTVEMMDRKGKAILMRWELISVVPVKMTGFSFNEYAEAYYATCELTVQAEEIVVDFIGSEDDVETAIPG